MLNIRLGCHHDFDASGALHVMFDELTERSLMSLTSYEKVSNDKTYMRKVSHNYPLQNCYYYYYYFLLLYCN